MKVLEGRVLRGGRLEATSVGIEDGRIVAIQRGLRGEEHWDFGEDLLLPGAIDVHVHMREPGMAAKEDFYTGTLAAAFGGVTTVLDMPNTRPPTVDLRSFNEKFVAARARANVDFGIIVGLAPGRDPRGLEALAAAYKVYMAETTGDLWVKDFEAVPDLLAPARRAGRVVIFHAEDPHYLKSLEEANLRDHLRARPPRAEVSAISHLRDLEGIRVHVAHVSAREALPILEAAGFSAEVTPHHLLLDASMEALRGLGKVNPPLRSRADREALLTAFVEAKIPILASDHAPHLLQEKEEFPVAPAGMPGVETMVPLMLRLVRQGIIPFERFVDAMATKPAATFGLANKGAIEVGKDGDIMVVRPGEVTKIRGEDLHHKCGWTAFEGWEATFPHTVFLRGDPVVVKGEVEGPLNGRFVAPPPPQASA